MAIKETTNHIKKLLAQITHDIEKADAGNKAASQRVRTGTVRLEKLAKVYRKESIAFDKKNKGVRKPSAKKATSAKSKKPAQTASKAKTASKVKAKAKTHKSSARAFSVKRKSPAKSQRRSSKTWLGKLF